ncbi:hypothetical protein KWV16_12140 [Clostridioides difficile]|nr:hypothetical protein [Clostridioides difficile]
MSNIIDISTKLTNEKPKIKISEDKVYTVNNSKNTVLIVNQRMSENNSNEIELIDDALKLLLGEKAFKEIDSMQLSFVDYKTIFVAVMAAISGETYEETETRFQNSK